MRIFTLVLLIQLLFLSSFAQKNSYSIAFYNVENLYDTIDQSHDDNAFLPTGKLNWNSNRYWGKIKNLNQVFDSIGELALIGLAEVENRKVVEDLFQYSPTRKDFDIIHFESDDPRGIDVAMAYNPQLLTKEAVGYFQPYAKTRGLLWSKFSYKKDTLLAIVAHFPSRLGGVKKTEGKRLDMTAAVLNFVDSVQKNSPEITILFMGDLNDGPENTSVQQLSLTLTPMISPTNGWYHGTYNYKGKWDQLDHLFVSENAFKGKIRFQKGFGLIHSNPFLVEKRNKTKQPKRGYEGTTYIGGYSDHLPISVKMSFK